MKSQILTQFPWPWLTAAALLIFFTFFMGVIVQVYRRSARTKMQLAATLPLEDAESIDLNQARAASGRAL